MSISRRVLLWAGATAALVAAALLAAHLLESAPEERLGEEVAAPGAAPPADRPVLPAAAERRPADRTAPVVAPTAAMGSAKGRVVQAATRRPVPGARIEALAGTSLGVLGLTEARPLGRRTESDAEGRFTLDGLAPRADLLLRIDGEDFALTDAGPFLVEAERATELGDLPVAGGITIAGDVIDPAARPVAGARVALHLGTDSPAPGAKPFRLTLTDGDGRFRFAHAIPTAFAVEVEAEGFARARRSGQPLPGEVSGEWPLHVQLEPVHRMRGRVVSLPGRLPVAGALVVARALDAERVGGSATSDAEGAFSLEGVAFGSYELLVTAKGFGRAIERNSAEARQDFVEIGLRPAGSLAGVVVGSDGAPIPHFDLQARRHGGKQDSPSPQGAFRRVNDPQGAFTLEDLEAGWWCVEAWAKGYVLTESACMRVKQGEHVEGLKVVLLRGAALVGTVVDDLGRPLAGASVSLRPDREPELELLREADAGPITRHRTRTDAEGRFRLEDLSTATVQVQVDHPEHAVARRDGVAIPPDGERELDAFVLERGASVEGRALDGNGTPLTGVTVRLYRVGGTARTVTTDGAGRYRFSRIPAGDYQLSCERTAASLFSTFETLKGGAGPQALRLAPGDARTLNVVAAD